LKTCQSTSLDCCGSGGGRSTSYCQSPFVVPCKITTRRIVEEEEEDDEEMEEEEQES